MDNRSSGMRIILSFLNRHTTRKFFEDRERASSLLKKKIQDEVVLYPEIFLSCLNLNSIKLLFKRYMLHELSSFHYFPI